MSGKWEIQNIPHSGWMCVDIEDFGAPLMTCQMCEREKIRYAHYMRHPEYKNVMIVGCICAGKMEGNSQKAKKRDSFMKSQMNKRKNWLRRKWKISRKGNQYIKSDGYIVIMIQKDGFWFARVKSENGNFNKWSTKKSKNENEMKLAAFDCLTSVLAVAENPLPKIEKKPQETVKKYSLAEDIPIEDIHAEDIPKEEKLIDFPRYFVQGDLFYTPVKTEGMEENVLPAEIAENTQLDAGIYYTSEQKNIFHFIKNGTGHGIIDAVAGAGKTTTIMECAKYAIDKSGVLFCAFNKSIQSEISKKFNKQGLNQITVKTIHSLGFQLLKDNNNTGKSFVPKESKYWTILNDDIKVRDQIKNYIEDLLSMDGYAQDEYESIKQIAVKSITYKFKERLLDMNQKIRATLTPDNFEKFINMVEHFGFFSDMETQSKHYKKEVEIYYNCGKILLNAGNDLAKESLIIDYTDMLYLPFTWNLRASKTYSFLFIDECQDLSKSQLAVVLKYGQKDGRILAVGDPCQSIYGFAGADIESFSRIKNTIGANPLPLTTCFRCPTGVVKLAADIRRDIAASKREHGIVEEITFKQVVRKAKVNDLIISRYKEPMLFLVFEFINKNIQVQIHRDEVNDIIDELKKLFKQDERAAIIAELPGSFETIKEIVLARWLFIIEKEAQKLENSSERQICIQGKTEYLNNRLEFLHKKYLQWKNSCQTINDMLLKIKEFISADDNNIKLSTIHRAKGLEARRVFILNFNDLPHFKPNQKSWERVQEQNLKYVAITRAMEELYLVKSEKVDDIKKEANLFDEFVSSIYNS